MLRKFNKLLSLIAGALMLATVSAKADVVVASAGPMSGQYASFGAQLKAGAEMWLKHVNKKGGINGEKVKLEIGDDACDPKQAVAVANKFAGQGVAYVAGHFCSGSSIPASAVYNEEGIIQVSPASTNPAKVESQPSGHSRRRPSKIRPAKSSTATTRASSTLLLSRISAMMRARPAPNAPDCLSE